MEAEANRRAKICAECPLNNDGVCDPKKTGKAVKDGIYHGQERKEGEEYSGCNCELWYKTQGPNSACPLLKWGPFELKPETDASNT